MTPFERASRLADNHEAGAAEILAELLPVLRDAIASGREQTIVIARLVCGAHPAMASLWHACAVALADFEQPGALAAFSAEVGSAPPALTRTALAFLHEALAAPAPLILTLSYSSSVANVLGELARGGPLRVVCGEGRPRYEGRRLAAALDAAGADVTLVVDSALQSFLPGASAVIVGADAVCAHRFINKVGTFGLAAAASPCGVRLYVLASRDKFVPRCLEPAIQAVEGNADEVWAHAPGSIRLANPYFEPIPSSLVTRFVTDAGTVLPSTLDSLVEARAAELERLLKNLRPR